MPKTIGTQLAVEVAAVIALPTRLAAASAASASRRPARLIACSMSLEPRKSTCSFGPGRAPVARSIASISRVARSLSYCPS